MPGTAAPAGPQQRPQASALKFLFLSVFFCCVFFASIARAQQPADPSRSLEGSLRALEASLPQELPHLSQRPVDDIARAAELVEDEAAELAYTFTRSPDELLSRIGRVTAAKHRVDDRLFAVLDMRLQIGDMPADDQQRAAVRNFLAACSLLNDLSGRLNHQLRDLVVGASFGFAARPEFRRRLVEQVEQDESTIGVAMLAPLLIDSPRDARNRARPAGRALKRKVLAMLGKFGRSESLPFVVRCLRDPRTPDDVAVAAVDAIVRLGLPQPRLPEQETEENASSPEITLDELYQRLQEVDASRLSEAYAKHRVLLLDFLRRHREQGVDERGYWKGDFWIQPGDWVLMRNSSPYNLFTDLSPGLFTHVGVAARYRGVDGIARLVLVDLNESEVTIDPANIERELPSALYYAVLRHEDPAVARKMAEIAASVVGNPMEFDLTFETSRVTRLKGQPLEGRKITTYCAGILLLCAQETGQPREEFFPIAERPAGGRLMENVRTIGLRAGADFISPTGPLFARRMQLVHFSEPMYDPSRDIEQRIYDYFARGLSDKVLRPRQNMFQRLRQQLADASKSNSVLAEALAQAAGVHRDTDLAAAARALAVVETLDSVALTASAEFRDAMRAFGIWPYRRPGLPQPSDEDQTKFDQLRREHTELYRSFREGRTTLHELYKALVEHYVASGIRQIDAHFFPDSATGN